MGNGSCDHHHHHHRHFQPKPIFLPMLCGLSIKDIIFTHRKKPVSAAAEEPSSPKVSCMGQVKRNNRVTGYPSGAGGATHHHQRYSRLRKLFSGKNLNPPAAASGGGAAGTRGKSFRFGGGDECAKSRRTYEEECGKVGVNIGEIDPPLPVVKRAAPPCAGGDGVSLWRRRCNGAAALKGLQIEQIATRLPNKQQQH